jgi:hypothetical protein
MIFNNLEEVETGILDWRYEVGGEGLGKDCMHCLFALRVRCKREQQQALK